MFFINVICDNKTNPCHIQPESFLYVKNQYWNPTVRGFSKTFLHASTLPMPPHRKSVARFFQKTIVRLQLCSCGNKQGHLDLVRNQITYNLFLWSFQNRAISLNNVNFQLRTCVFLL